MYLQQQQYKVIARFNPNRTWTWKQQNNFKSNQAVDGASQATYNNQRSEVKLETLRRRS